MGLGPGLRLWEEGNHCHSESDHQVGCLFPSYTDSQRPCSLAAKVPILEFITAQETTVKSGRDHSLSTHSPISPHYPLLFSWAKSFLCGLQLSPRGRGTNIQRHCVPAQRMCLPFSLPLLLEWDSKDISQGHDIASL